jgi:hypothetical protein
MLVALIIIVTAGAVAALASAAMSWASNRSAVWNMVFGGALAFVVLACAPVIALLMTRAAYPWGPAVGATEPRL